MGYLYKSVMKDFYSDDELALFGWKIDELGFATPPGDYSDSNELIWSWAPQSIVKSHIEMYQTIWGNVRMILSRDNIRLIYTTCGGDEYKIHELRNGLGWKQRGGGGLIEPDGWSNKMKWKRRDDHWHWTPEVRDTSPL